MEDAAASLKAAGNASLKAGALDEAIGAYSRALSTPNLSATTRVALLSNRALAQLRLRQFAPCVDDCTAALALEPAHVKALYRRAQARAALGHLPTALHDTAAVIKLEPANAEARAMHVQLKAEYETVLREGGTGMHGRTDGGVHGRASQPAAGGGGGGGGGIANVSISSAAVSSASADASSAEISSPDLSTANREAATQAFAAGERALASGDLQRAVRFLRKASALSPADEEMERTLGEAERELQGILREQQAQALTSPSLTHVPHKCHTSATQVSHK